MRKMERDTVTINLEDKISKNFKINEDFVCKVGKITRLHYLMNIIPRVEIDLIESFKSIDEHNICIEESIVLLKEVEAKLRRIIVE